MDPDFFNTQLTSCEDIDSLHRKIKFVTVALQRRAGVIDEATFEKFVTHETALLTKAPKPSDFYFKGTQKRELFDDTLLCRIVPLDEGFLNRFSASNAPEPFSDAFGEPLGLLKSWTGHLNETARRAMVESWSEAFRRVRNLEDADGRLPKVIPEELAVIRVRHLDDSSVHGGKKGPVTTPRFATLFCGKDGQMHPALRRCFQVRTKGSRYTANRLRDLLGLSYLNARYDGVPVALGFIVYRYGDLSERKARRPTAFDGVEIPAFLGVHGEEGSEVTNTGRTARLSAIANLPNTENPCSLTGSKELVLKDTTLAKEDDYIYLGFAGILNDSIKTYREGASRDELIKRDKEFLRHLSRRFDDAKLHAFYVDGNR